MIDYQYVAEYFEQFPLLIKLVWALSGILFLLILGLIIFMKFLRIHLKKNEEFVNKFQKEYESSLITYLYSGDDNQQNLTDTQQAIVDEMKKNSSDDFKREIIVSVLLKLRNEISGEVADSIQDLYFRVGLNNYAKEKLKSYSWNVVAEGVSELTQFEVKEVEKEMMKLLNYPKHEVRKEVQLYLVYLFKFQGLSFLNDLKTCLTEWDQIQLLEILERFDDQQIPDITPWLNSKNDSVVIFALKLAKIYNQFGVINTLLDLLNHKNTSVRVQAIKVLNYFHVSEAKSVLKENFNLRSKLEQIEIFKMLESITNQSDEEFIIDYINNPVFEIRFSALKILKNLNKEKLLELKNENSDSKFNEIINFIENN